MATSGSPTVEADAPPWAVRARRVRSFDGDGRLATGTASALADLVGVEPALMRLAFVVVAVAGGWGFLAYGATWLWFVVVEPPPDRPDGAVAVDPVRDLGLAIVVVGLVIQARVWDVGFNDAVVWPVLVVALAVGASWRRGVPVEVREWLRGTDARVGIGRLSVRSRTLRLVGGGTLVLVGSIGTLSGDQSLGVWIRTAGSLAVVVAGVAVMFGPTLRVLGTALIDERQQRVRADERAVISRHLHDSVLQTLALIQKRSTDPGEVATLARRQERELRQWLYGDGERHRGTVGGALEAAADEVEDLHRVAVECVVVGDAVLDDRGAAVVAAAREAMVNAAKFSGAALVSTYAELGDDRIEVFVRDRGAGFDVTAVPDDRHGISGSIVARVQGIGGTAEIRSAPGEGTEVHLVLPRGVTARGASS